MTMSFLARTATMLGPVLLGGCHSDIAPPRNLAPEVPGPVISISQSAYSWSHDSVIVATLRNPAGVPIYYNCQRYRLQHYRKGWRDVPLPLGYAGCPTSQLAASESLTVTPRLTNDFIPTSGWYRVVFRVFRDADLQHPWAHRSQLSPVFEVTP